MSYTLILFSNIKKQYSIFFTTGGDRVDMEKKKADEKVKKMKGDIENMESNIHKVSCRNCN